MKTTSTQMGINAETRRTRSRAKGIIPFPLSASLRSWRLCVGLGLAVASTAFAATNDLSGLLQKGLFEEEANRNLDAASAAYETLVKQFDKDRQIGATAVFRLGEVYRKQGKTNEAAAQYERIVRDFAEQTTLVTLSRQNLAGIRQSPVLGDVPMQSGLGNASEETTRLAAQLKGIEQLEGDPEKQARAVLAFFPDETLKKMLLQLPKLQKQEAIVRENPTLQYNKISEKLAEKIGYSPIANGSSWHTAYNPDGLEPERHGTNFITDAQWDLRKQLAWIQERVTFTVGIQKARLQVLQVVAVKTPVREAATSETSAATTDEEEAEIRRIQAMIQNSPDLINAASGDPSRTPLGRAAEKGQLRVADYLLNNGADVNVPVGNSTPLSIAARNGHKKMVELLLARGAAVDAVDSERRTPLHVAVSRNYPAVMEALLAAKADPNAKDNNDNTPLMAAIRSGSLPMAQALLARGANPNIVNKVPSNTGFGSVGANERAVFGSALHFAAGRGSVPLTRLLLTNRADVTLRSTFGETALHVAAANGHTEAVALLIAAGADANARGSEALTGGATPLHLATSARAADVVKLLLENKADPNPTAIYGGAGVTPLMLAANGTDAELIALLLKYKADPNQTDANGYTALVNAVRARNAETVRVLLAGGANPDTRRPDRSPGYPVLMLAVTDYASKEVVAALIAAKANVNAFDPDGKTPLHWAASGDRKDLAELLIKAGADVNLRDKQGKTPLDFVKGNNQTAGAFGMPPPRPAMPAPIPAPAASASARSKPDEVALMLRQHGALDELPDFTRIRITRQGLVQPHVVFVQGAATTNRFTLLETLMRFYNQESVYWETQRAYTKAYNALPFPDFGRILIHRPNPKLSAKEQEIKVSLLNRSNQVDCAKDVAVEFGDVIEIPERVHALNEALDDPVREMEKMFKRVKAGLSAGVPPNNTFAQRVAAITSGSGEVAAQYAELLTCLQKSVQLVVAGSPTTLTVDSWKEGFLNQALSKVEARAALRSSSDLTRVQVKRKSPKTSKLITLTVDATEANDSLWLQDGDVIEVPDKP